MGNCQAADAAAVVIQCLVDDKVNFREKVWQIIKILWVADDPQV
jgi:hypothetical protein